MVLSKIYIIPHGDEIIDLPDINSREMNEKITRIAGEDKSEVLVIISPHGVTLGKGMAVINTEFFVATTDLIDKKLNYRAKNERELTEKIIKECPEICNELRYSTYSGDLSVFPLDFGSSIPLYFFKKRNIVYVGQPRLDDRDALVNFGKKLYGIANGYNKNVSIILSADQAHTHSDKGPYGYSDQAEVYEDILIKALNEGNLEPVYKMNQDIISRGKPDSYWNMLILKGLLDTSGRKMVMDFHYVALYFGMLLAHSN